LHQQSQLAGLASIPVSFQGVAKSYGKHPVLNDIDLQVLPGQTLGLVGLNGAGKSTLLKSLLDLTAIDAGRIEIFGSDHRHPDARSSVAYLAENFQPQHFVHGADFLRFITQLHGVSLTQAAVDAECAALELDRAALDRPVKEYSKGMRQKLGLIGCLLSERPLLVMDEPMSGLDPQARALFGRRLRRLKDNGTSLFFSTHLLEDVSALCDCMAVLHDGRIRFDGAVESFTRAYPADSLESAFLRCIERSFSP